MHSRLFYFAASAVLAFVGFAAALALHRVEELASDLEQANADRAQVRAELNEQEAASQTLAEQVKRLGGKPVVEPSKPGPVTPPSINLTDEQTDAAVAEWCSVGDRCKPEISRADVRQALADICANDACDAPPAKDGTDGKDGADGADSTVPGPAATDAQLDAAVARFCAANDCIPEDGKDGKDGTDGKDGADGKDATITPSGADCPDGQRVNGVHLLADGSLTVSCAPLVGRG